MSRDEAIFAAMRAHRNAFSVGCDLDECVTSSVVAFLRYTAIDKLRVGSSQHDRDIGDDLNRMADELEAS